MKGFKKFKIPQNQNRKDGRPCSCGSEVDSRKTEDDELVREKYRSMYLEMPLEEKRKLYRCGYNYITLEEIPPWPAFCMEYYSNIVKTLKKNPSREKESKHCLDINHHINNKISLWQGDITKLEIDAIVNAANSSLRGGGGLDGSIHKAAGRSLLEECITLNGCNKGQAKITCGHKLPAKFVIHTVGPRRGQSPHFLNSCYENCLRLVLEHNIRTIAFSCISTGLYAFPNRHAAHIALRTAREWLEVHHERIDRIIFCTYVSKDFNIYGELMAGVYFPCDTKFLMRAEITEREVESNISLQDEEFVKRKSDIPAEMASTPSAKQSFESHVAYNENTAKESELSEHLPNFPSKSVDISPAKVPVESDCVYDESNVTKPKNNISIDACTVINVSGEVDSASDDYIMMILDEKERRAAARASLDGGNGGEASMEFGSQRQY